MYAIFRNIVISLETVVVIVSVIAGVVVTVGSVYIVVSYVVFIVVVVTLLSFFDTVVVEVEFSTLVFDVVISSAIKYMH